MRQRAKADNLTICYRKKQIAVSFSYVWPVIDSEFRHNIVKVVCGATLTIERLSMTLTADDKRQRILLILSSFLLIRK